MPYYIMLSNLTDEGAKTIKTNPERIKAVNAEVEAMGVKILAQYAVLGPYDFVNVLEAPDNTTITRLSMELASRGSLKMMTLAAIPIDEFIKSIKK
ncbi:GYD domain-containing protein [Candidatus Poribacteria bacterium]|nr:GYD domain-containing protein [Candidatus Poribacteria bacterium]